MSCYGEITTFCGTSHRIKSNAGEKNTIQNSHCFRKTSVKQTFCVIAFMNVARALCTHNVMNQEELHGKDLFIPYKLTVLKYYRIIIIDFLLWFEF